MKKFAALALASTLAAGGLSSCSSDGCPDGVVEQLEHGLEAVKADLPPGTIKSASLNTCESGDAPSFTVYVNGKHDPVRQLVRTNSAWTEVPREASDRATGYRAERPFDDATLHVGASPLPRWASRFSPSPASIGSWVSASADAAVHKCWPLACGDS